MSRRTPMLPPATVRPDRTGRHPLPGPMKSVRLVLTFVHITEYSIRMTTSPGRRHAHLPARPRRYRLPAAHRPGAAADDARPLSGRPVPRRDGRPEAGKGADAGQVVARLGVRVAGRRRGHAVRDTPAGSVGVAAAGAAIRQPAQPPPRRQSHAGDRAAVPPDGVALACPARRGRDQNPTPLPFPHDWSGGVQPGIVPAKPRWCPECTAGSRLRHPLEHSLTGTGRWKWPGGGVLETHDIANHRPRTGGRG